MHEELTLLRGWTSVM